MEKRFLAVDIGASSGRHIVGWREDGAVRTEEAYRFPNGVKEEGGHLVWDMDGLLFHVKAGIQAAMDRFGPLESLSIDTWGCDYVLLRGEEEVRPCYAYRDGRTQGVMESVHGRMPFPELYARTGCQFQPFNTLYQLCSDLREGRLEGATDFLMVPEYLLWKLTGVKVKEYTNATTTGLVNAGTGEFDLEIVRALALPEGLFPALTRPGTAMGAYRGIKVVLCATHDTASAVEGILAAADAAVSPTRSAGRLDRSVAPALPTNSLDFVGPPQLYLSSGTWSLLGVKSPVPHTDEKSRLANYSNEGGVGYIRYQKNIMGMWIVNRLRDELCPDKPFPDILAEAEASAFDGTVDANAPAFLAPESMRAAFDGALDPMPRSVGDYFRCACRSLALSYRDAIRELEENTGRSYETLYIVGGGAKNTFLNQLTQEATGKRVVALPIEATALGNLKIQMEVGSPQDCRDSRSPKANDVPNVQTIAKTNGGNVMSYQEAKAKYAALGVDTDGAIAALQTIPVSLHCWQGDDVRGFDTDPDAPLTGGIQTTGNYPGRARTPEELMADLDAALKLCPGRKKLNLHASYAIFEDGQWADRDRLEPKHFAPWVKFCKERGLGADFNPTFFSHPKCDPLTLASPHEETRQFWIEHGRACIRISQYLARELGQPCVMNIWTGDGFKDIPGDRMGPRERYRDSIDRILSEPYDFRLVKPCIESKVFGIGVEAYTVGSAEFALSYAAFNRDKCIPLMDNGHYHPTEVVSDKIPALLAFFPEIALHVTRPIRWDSDHVVLFDDETREICREIVRCGAHRVNIALDYFDASINRVAAWAVGFRNLQKALLSALLQPCAELKALQDGDSFTKLMVLQEELKTAPFGEVWDEYCRVCGVPLDGRWFDSVQQYEADVLSKRG